MSNDMTNNGLNRFQAPVIKHETEESDMAYKLSKLQNIPTKDGKITKLKKTSELDRNKSNRGNKAVLDFRGLEDLKFGDVQPVFEITDPEKINVVIPPGKLLTLTFGDEMKSASNSSSKVGGMTITMSNKQSLQPRLVSFSIGQDGLPLIRGEMKSKVQSMENKRHYMSIKDLKGYNVDFGKTEDSSDSDKKSTKRPPGYFINLNDKEYSAFSKALDKDGLRQLHINSQIPHMTPEQARTAKYNAYGTRNDSIIFKRDILGASLAFDIAKERKEDDKLANRDSDQINDMVDKDTESHDAKKRRERKYDPQANSSASLTAKLKLKGTPNVIKETNHRDIKKKGILIGDDGQNRKVRATEAAKHILWDLEHGGENPLSLATAWRTSSLRRDEEDRQNEIKIFHGDEKAVKPVMPTEENGGLKKSKNKSKDSTEEAQPIEKRFDNFTYDADDRSDTESVQSSTYGDSVSGTSTPLKRPEPISSRDQTKIKTDFYFR